VESAKKRAALISFGAKTARLFHVFTGMLCGLCFLRVVISGGMFSHVAKHEENSKA
jgi:hypothetical protein